MCNKRQKIGEWPRKRFVEMCSVQIRFGLSIDVQQNGGIHPVRQSSEEGKCIRIRTHVGLKFSMKAVGFYQELRTRYRPKIYKSKKKKKTKGSKTSQKVFRRCGLKNAVDLFMQRRCSIRLDIVQAQILHHPPHAHDLPLTPAHYPSVLQLGHTSVAS